MRQIADIRELRGIQLDILDEIVRICTDNGIGYSLSSGTLLGAVRHKGYIPWDDDIDLYMMRSEYGRFVECFKEQARFPYELRSPGDDDYLYLFGKVIDSRTVMREDEVPGSHMGVYVDIFPIDYVPEDSSRRSRYYKRLYLIQKIRKCKKLDYCFLKSKWAYRIYRNLPISVRTIDRILDSNYFNGKATAKVCNLAEGAKLPSQRCFSASLFDDLVDIEFEGKFYSAFRDYDSYLSNTYGNYMELPPVEKRVTHSFKVWWKD